MIGRHHTSISRYDAVQVERSVTAGNTANATATAGNTIMNTQIITRLGDPITGGLSGWSGRLNQQLGIDRWLNLIDTAMLIHNAIMILLII
jgi:hypothetical protein